MSPRTIADLIVEGRIATLAGEAGFGWQPAIAVGEGRVLATGPIAEIEVLAGPRTARWRLAGNELAMPGITDAHLHLMLLVLAEMELDLAPTPDLPATLGALRAAHRARVDAGDRDGWLLGHGWSLDGLGRWPDAAMLDEACPGRPVALYAHDHHSRWISSRAMELAVIEPRTEDPPSGIVRRDESGRPTGILHETATGMVDRAIPDPDRATLEAGLARQAAALAELGVTGCHDPAELTDDPRIVRGPVLYRALAAAGRLPLRVHASVRAPQLETAIGLGLRSGQGVASEHDDARARRIAERFRMGWLKLFADGSLGSRSAALLEPYSDAAERPPTGGPTGMYLASAEELRDDLSKAARAGIDGQVHAIGDAAVRMALDVLAGLPAGRLARRVEHAQLVDPADQPRFGRDGVAASVQPVHLRTDAAPARIAWSERVENAFPLAGLLAGGALIPFGTDAPVEPADPWPGICVAVARRDPERPADRPLGVAHAIPLARAIRAACLDPAIAAGERESGRLVAGYRADLLIVPAAGFGEPPDFAALARTRPRATVIDGEVVFRDAGWDVAG